MRIEVMVHFFVLILIVVARPARAAESSTTTVTSPDGRLAVNFSLDAAGVPTYSIQLDGQPALAESRLGLVRDDADFSQGLRLVSTSDTQPVEDDYQILTAKRRHNRYRANRAVFHLATATGQKIDVIFQVSNDGVAFRNLFPGTSDEVRRLTEEVSSFHFLPGTVGWLQPMSVPKLAGRR